MNDRALDLFHRPTRAWFAETFSAPTDAQAGAWPAIVAGESTLLLAPTGSGKTLAAFLAAIDALAFSPTPTPRERCRVLYVSPLKALAVDIERNLRAPLAGVTAAATRLGEACRELEVGVRTGDTPAAARARMQRAPPDILITTPESLYLLATSAARVILASIDTVIVDEIHALLPTKRGAHLFVTLERIAAQRARARPNTRPLQRIGLSATQRDLDEVSRLLGGFTAKKTPRPVTIVDARRPRSIALRVEVAVEDMRLAGEVESAKAETFATRGAARGPAKASLWPSIHARLIDEISSHRSTIVFVNSRRLAERLAGALNELATERAGHALDRPFVEAHHGSVAREKRALMEERLKRGELRAIVATSSLELGIDMGDVDQVVQIEPPPSVSSALQRIGRAKHQVGGTPTGLIIPKHRGDLLGCAAIARQAVDGEIESTRAPRNPLDVLAQQIVAIVAGDFGADAQVPIEAIFKLVRGAASFAELPRSSFDGVLDMLGGRYASNEMADDFAELRPRLVV
ncbi:MAG: DEAD/DEAH box helicase, partial [Polyangiales bacterium]